MSVRRCGVLGEVVGAVVLPQPVDLVHRAVVPVEEEVEHNAVHANLDDDPGREADRLLAGLVGEHDGHGGADERRGDQRVHGVGD